MPEEIDKIYTLTDILHQTAIVQPAIVQQLVYQNGKTIIAGKPKVGKSRLALALSISVAKGADFMGLKVRKAQVLYLELDRRNLTATIRELTDEDNSNWCLVKHHIMAINEDKGFKYLKEKVEKTKANLIIIDHKSVAMGGKENEDLPTRNFLKNLDAIAGSERAIILISQENKGNKADIVDKVIGSQLLAAWADTIVVITRVGENFRRLDSASNYGDIASLTYTKDFKVVKEKIEYSKKDIVAEMLRDDWEEIKKKPSKAVEEIAGKTGFSYKTIWDAYRELKQEESLKVITVEETIIRE